MAARMRCSHAPWNSGVILENVTNIQIKFHSNLVSIGHTETDLKCSDECVTEMSLVSVRVSADRKEKCISGCRLGFRQTLFDQMSKKDEFTELR